MDQAPIILPLLYITSPLLLHPRIPLMLIILMTTTHPLPIWTELTATTTTILPLLEAAIQEDEPDRARTHPNQKSHHWWLNKPQAAKTPIWVPPIWVVITIVIITTTRAIIWIIMQVKKEIETSVLSVENCIKNQTLNRKKMRGSVVCVFTSSFFFFFLFFFLSKFFYFYLFRVYFFFIRNP